MPALKLHLLLDEQLPFPNVFKNINKHHNLRHVKFSSLKGKEDLTVYLGAKKDGRILITMDKMFYLNNKFKFFKDTGIIYVKDGDQSYNLPPETIEKRLNKLFKTLLTKDQYYNTKIKVCDDHAFLKRENDSERKISI